ncbi:MAG: IclR family transcriptional regulator [Burkholderiaceae bacterium]
MNFEGLDIHEPELAAPFELSAGAPPKGSALLRAIEILEFVSQADRQPALSEICRAVDLPKATVFRILSTLEHAGYIGKEPGAKRYGCGARLHDLSLRVLQHSPGRAPRHAILEELVEQIGETCNLTVPDSHTVMYIDRVEAAWPLRVALGVGSRVPLYASASGKLFLSHMSKRSLERFVHSTPLVRYTEKTLTDPGGLMRALDDVRHHGYAIDDEEYLHGIRCLAVPVRDRDGAVVAALAAHGPVSRMEIGQVMTYLPALQRAAQDIGRTFER